MKKVLFLTAIIAALASCSETKREEPVTFRANCLESSTITYVRCTEKLSPIYKDGDTVWVNMNTHYIDDVDTTAQKCVLSIK